MAVDPGYTPVLAASRPEPTVRCLRRHEDANGPADSGGGLVPGRERSAMAPPLSQVLSPPHPDEGDPAPDGRQVGGEQALDEYRRGSVGLRDPGRGEAEDHARFHDSHAAR